MLDYMSLFTSGLSLPAASLKFPLKLFGNPEVMSPLSPDLKSKISQICQSWLAKHGHIQEIKVKIIGALALTNDLDLALAHFKGLLEVQEAFNSFSTAKNLALKCLESGQMSDFWRVLSSSQFHCENFGNKSQQDLIVKSQDELFVQFFHKFCTDFESCETMFGHFASFAVFLRPPVSECLLQLFPEGAAFVNRQSTCFNCKQRRPKNLLTAKDFKTLSQAVMEKCVLKNDLYGQTFPAELKEFQDMLDRNKVGTLNLRLMTSKIFNFWRKIGLNGQKVMQIFKFFNIIGRKWTQMVFFSIKWPNFDPKCQITLKCLKNTLN